MDDPYRSRGWGLTVQRSVDRGQDRLGFIMAIKWATVIYPEYSGEKVSKYILKKKNFTKAST
jgi:hypothetical protein